MALEFEEMDAVADIDALLAEVERLREALTRYECPHDDWYEMWDRAINAPTIVCAKCRAPLDCQTKKPLQPAWVRM